MPACRELSAPKPLKPEKKENGSMPMRPCYSQLSLLYSNLLCRTAG